MSPMAEKILAYIRQNGDASFANLSSLLGEDGKGNMMWELGGPNIILWSGMSETFIEALQELRPIIEPRPAHLLVYLVDGMIPRMPIAKRPTRKGYKTEHWLPVVFVERDAKSKATYAKTKVAVQSPGKAHPSTDDAQGGQS